MGRQQQVGGWERVLALRRSLEEGPNGSIRAARDWLRVRRRDGHTVPLVANAAQRCFEQRRGRQNIVLKARQMGMTTWVAGQFFLRTVTRPGTLTVLVAHTREAAEAIFASVERMWAHLPEDLRQGALRRDRANAGGMRFAEIGSEFRVASAADANAGRGLSIQNLHCSEVSRWPGDAAGTLAGLRAALAPGGELVLESTPYGAYGAFYEEWQRGQEAGSSEQEAGEHTSGLVRHFFPWWMELAYKGPPVRLGELSEEERVLVAREGLSSRQIGFRRGLERTYGVLRRQEFAEDPETCFRATGACCFDVAAIEGRLTELQPARETRRNGALEIYLPPANGREYCVAVDTAGGGEDGDFAAVQVVELGSGLQCAELRERLRPVELACVAAELAREYGRALVAVERNNHGAAVLAYLEMSTAAARALPLYRGADGHLGWLTTASSKAGMVTRMERLLREAPELFRSRRLLAECRSFVSGENGRTGAARGSHDDLLMAMAIAHAVRDEGSGMDSRAR